MSDILTDQKIYYIVKDYRRMYGMHDELVSSVKKASDAIKHKDNRIRDLEKQISNLKMQLTETVPLDRSRIIRNKAILARDQMKATEARVAKGIKLMEDLIATIESEVEIEEPVVCNGEIVDIEDENTL